MVTISISLYQIGRDKLGCNKDDHTRLVLESDGTHIDDEEYLNWLPDNTTFLLLRGSETWTKQIRQHHECGRNHQADPSTTGQTADALLVSPIPRVVCEALNLLEIHHEPPFWKIIDNRGRITLVLHWEQPRNNRICYVEPLRSAAPRGTSLDSSNIGPSRSLADLKIHSAPIHPSEDIITVVSADGATITTIRGGRIDTLASSNDIPTNTSEILNPVMATAARVRSSANCGKSGPTSNSLPHSTASHLPVPPKPPAPSMISSNSSFPGRSSHSHYHHHQQHITDDCEFHCGSLHDEGRGIHREENRSAAHVRNNQQVHQPHQHLETTTKTAHVRFTHAIAADNKSAALRAQQKRYASKPPTRVLGLEASNKGEEIVTFRKRDSSESEMEPESSNTVEEEFESESGITSDKLLLLTDQLSTDQRKHLTILDLGVILERLKAKIIDVEKLEREREGPSCFRWIIKATIRGDVLRDLGVLYNGNYYSISEDPGLACAASGFEDEDEDKEAKL